MTTLTKEWLLKTIAELEEERDATPGAVNEDAVMALEAMKLALASLEAEPVAFIGQRMLEELTDGARSCGRVWPEVTDKLSDENRIPLYTAPPAPVSVPDGYRLQPISEYDAMCAAMLQVADGTLANEGTIKATQFKPVADLYGLTSPAGGETSFTFDAVEARDFIDGGWSCQEYVELGRFQDAVIGNSPAIPDGYALVPKEMTDEIGEAISMQARCCGGIALDIYDAMITAASQEVK